jgi:hypothetical protein
MAQAVDGEAVYDWMLNQKFTYSGLEENIGDVVPATMGETYWCTDSLKLVMSSNGSDWDLLLCTAVAYP